MFLKVLEYLKAVKKVTYWFFAIFGIISLPYVGYKFYNNHMLFDVCFPKQWMVLNLFIKEVPKQDLVKLKNEKAFMDYEGIKEGMFKNKEDLIKVCKMDFSEKYEIINVETSNQCYQANYYIKFRNKSIYVIKLSNTAKPSLFCRCPGYEVVSVEKLAGCGM